MKKLRIERILTEKRREFKGGVIRALIFILYYKYLKNNKNTIWE